MTPRSGGRRSHTTKLIGCCSSASVWVVLLVSWLTTAALPQLPVLTYTGGGDVPVISDAQREASAGRGFEGGRAVRQPDGSVWLFTAEFQGLPVNANMRIAIWRANSTAAAAAAGGWERRTTIAASAGDPADWNSTCRTDNLRAAPWAPFPVYDDSPGEGRWHVHWVSYACDLSWCVRSGVGNILGAASTVAGIGGIGGPYASYAGNSVVIGPNASTAAGSTATRFGDLGSCAVCHVAPKPGGAVPPFCSTPPCLFDNGKTGAAISAGPFALPPGAAARFASFVGLSHHVAWADSMRGPWTVGTAQQVGQDPMAKLSTPSAMYTENPVVSALGAGLVATFDTVSPSGGWVVDGARGTWVPGGRGESFGFGMAFSVDGGLWSNGVDVRLPGGCRTPLGLLDGGDGTATMLFTRRFADCADQTLPAGSRGDAANDPTMCANLYAATFNVSWRDWQPGE